MYIIANVQLLPESQIGISQFMQSLQCKGVLGTFWMYWKFLFPSIFYHSINDAYHG